jgi:hypothetical protein
MSFSVTTMSDSDDIDGWYANYVASLEENQYEGENGYDTMMREALESMTTEEFNAIRLLNEAVKISKRKYSQPGLTKEQYDALLADYMSKLAAYRAATAKWPILEDGF